MWEQPAKILSNFLWGRAVQSAITPEIERPFSVKRYHVWIWCWDVRWRLYIIFYEGGQVNLRSLRKGKDLFPGKEHAFYDLIGEHSEKILSHFLRGRAVQSALIQVMERSFSGGKNILYYDLIWELLEKILSHFLRGRAVQPAIAQGFERSFSRDDVPCWDLMLEHSVKILPHFRRGRAGQSALAQEIERSFSRKSVPSLDLRVELSVKILVHFLRGGTVQSAITQEMRRTFSRKVVPSYDLRWGLLVESFWLRFYLTSGEGVQYNLRSLNKVKDLFLERIYHVWIRWWNIRVRFHLISHEGGQYNLRSLRKLKDLFPGKNVLCLDLMLEHSVRILPHFLRGRAVQAAITQEIERSFSRERAPSLDLRWKHPVKILVHFLRGGTVQSVITHEMKRHFSRKLVPCYDLTLGLLVENFRLRFYLTFGEGVQYNLRSLNKLKDLFHERIYHVWIRCWNFRFGFHPISSEGEQYSLRVTQEMEWSFPRKWSTMLWFDVGTLGQDSI